MKTPQASKTLNELMVRAEHFANATFHSQGKMPPALFAATPTGPMVFVPQSLSDAQAKDNFANTARLMCVAQAATAAVIALEAWATFAKPGESLDMDTPPSEAPERKELVVLMVEAAGVQKQKLLPIIRTDAGGFLGFGELKGLEVASFKGRFAEMLPPKPPTEKQRADAAVFLDVLGVKFALPRSTRAN